ncbi:MAG: 4-(cytidine 5'-diphospho)-2-C-methyl-D-erythritol kinase, partial [Candidatus Omnitrophota bacterium]
GQDNLAYRAAALLKKAAGVKSGVEITIEKHIPAECGLGGGSSNAATVLKGLNRLWRLGLSQKELLGLAEKIGSDVSFFVYEVAFALGKGRGERIRPLKGIKPLWHIVIAPQIKIPTPFAFRRFDRRHTNLLTKTSGDVNIFIRALREHNLVLTSKCLFNDFSRDLLYRHPGLLKTKKALEGLTGREASFSGKGPAIFSLVNSAKEAGYLKIKLARSHEKVFIVKTF